MSTRSAAGATRLPPPFLWLFGAHATSNLGDGILLAAGPLLVSSLTLDPLAVSGALVAQRLPWVVFGLLAGVVVDRVDRQRLVMLADASRAAVLGMLAAAVVTDRLSLLVIYLALFLLGTAETFGDNASSTMVVATVPDAQLGRANSRLVASSTITNNLAGPPLGALLFGVGVALPFVAEAALMALAAVLVSRVRLRPRAQPEPDGPPPALRTRLAEGLTWLRRNPPVRRLAVLITLFNITFGATYSILVLYALEELGLDERGFGLLLTASAVGGLVGAAAFTRLERRFSYTAMLRAGLVIESTTHLVLGSTSSWAVAAAMLTVFGVHEAVWGSLSHTIRMRLTPEHLLGRVNSVYYLAVIAPLPLAALLGGWIADTFTIPTTFFVAGTGAWLTTIWAWRGIADLDVQPEPDAPATT